MDQLKPPLLIKKGAEASLYLAKWHGRKVIEKKRLPKRYRHSVLEEQIRVYRTIHEPELMHESKKAGVATPKIFLVDVENSTIIMEFVEGNRIKELFGKASKTEREALCHQIGELVARLHRGGIIHGDLTTSNMIMNLDGRIFLVDFGLGEISSELEVRGVDLHLLKRALQSTHFRLAQKCFEHVLEGYSKVLGAEAVKSVLAKIGEIERRGRYVTERRNER